MKKYFWVLLLVSVFLGCLGGCNSETERSPRSLDDFRQSKMGVLTGSSHELIAKENFPDAELVYFSRPADMTIAVSQGKIDCYMFGSPFLPATIWENVDVKRLDEAVAHGDIAFAFPKDSSSDRLRGQLNDFLQQSAEDGTLARLEEKWHGDSEPTEHPDYESLTGENGTIRLAAVAENKPMIYQYKTQCTGYEMELLTLFARQYGYRFEIETVPFDSVIMGMATGKYDMTAACLQVTPERSESVNFSNPYMQFDVVLVVKDDDGQTSDTKKIQTLKDLDNQRVAVMMGTVWANMAKTEFPLTEVKYFSTTADTLLALEQGMVEAVLGPRTFFVTARWENVPVTVLEETVGAISSGFMLAKENYDPVLLGQLNEFIAQSKADGTTAAIAEKWFSDSEPTEHPDYESLTGENGTLRIAVDNTAKPMVYRKNDTFTGYDIDFLTLFARRYGYKPEFVGMAFDSLLAFVSSGKCHMGACGIGITPERAESVTFTDSYLELDGVVIVSEDSVTTAREESFFDEMALSFEKTFIRENRWQLILDGIGVTLVISLCAAAVGTVLGLGLYLLSRSGVKALRSAAKEFGKIYARIIAGTPAVVVLMILFYVIFGSIRNMSGIAVAIIGFSLIFGAFVYEHLTVAVNSIDKGQTEAAYALGYTKNKAFFRIVFPQAMKIFLPAYCGNAVDLVKATAIVGYIAVNDLTKISDIIRSNTYEAFFPLLATALIYFILTWMLSLLLGIVKNRFNPEKRRPEAVLRGIKTE